MQDLFSRQITSLRPSARVVEADHSGFWREEDPVLNDQSMVIKGGMFPHQRNWYTLPNYIKALIAGLGAGKTMIGAKRIISLALHNAPVPAIAVSPTFPMARQTTIPTIISLLQGKQSIYGRAFAWRYNKTFHEFAVRFHGREALIKIGSGDDPDSLKGANLGAGWIDEPAIQAYEVFQEVNNRLRHPDAQTLELLLTGTPENLGWVYDLCMGELGLKFEKVGREGARGVGTIFASSRANPVTAATGYIQKLEASYDDKAAQAYIDAQFVNLSKGQVYYKFNPIENAVDRKIPYGAELGVGMDFNVNPMAAAVFWTWRDQMHFFDEIELPNSDTEYMCSLLKERYWDQGLRLVYPDATGSSRATQAPGARTDFWYITQAGFEIKCRSIRVGHYSNPERKDRYNAVNGKFCARNGKVTLTVSPSRCPKLIKYLIQYSHEVMNETAQKAMSHLCFTGDTFVDVPNGPVQMSLLPEMGYVRTWDGTYVPYQNAGLIKRQVPVVSVHLSNGQIVRCTPDHKWLTTNGWHSAEDLVGKDLPSWSVLSRLRAKSSMGSGSTATTDATIERQTGEARLRSIESFGNTAMGTSRRGTTSTTKTRIGRTTRSRTFGAFRSQSTLDCTRGSQIESRCFSLEHILLESEQRLRGIGRLQEENGTEHMACACRDSAELGTAHARARSVQPLSRLPGVVRSSAAALARRSIGASTKSITKRASVDFARSRSQSTDSNQTHIAPDDVLRVIAVMPAGVDDVYCLTVPSAGCFALSNGRVVANCDAFSYPVAYLHTPVREILVQNRLLGV